MLLRLVAPAIAGIGHEHSDRKLADSWTAAEKPTDAAKELERV